ncbi:hypothetical protein H112_08017 [Trichophyton rubrum D6]|uniref:Uncharacterized protein n=2 Tax=Trichophyton rubrum TaxID=5551 RepID=A0A080WK10_TRIRC|nr:uncharacterized protein TERG_11598 [Trichophyton rubrum CBS 118892]EZF10816.1 hypothetical protein H100_08045 [Trichophyton rubrum MR850]EZF37711.1 hypothetical protein H102_08003 [Trichophyton rubrum CBS 100081]EZF48391.1 hypothetical protein H103_08028 [Trichophyton rubrum CBS 288.86]EZF58982.1 hypothetical protein H104_07976 [Trichophyton rubrum CBS 289.86]EZF80269.1 hypothetical protein H110_08028 [Trichophyton rubrum MR1448]EZF90930.1 hypothetical protein H113_08091 [Trichophyton rubr
MTGIQPRTKISLLWLLLWYSCLQTLAAPGIKGARLGYEDSKGPRCTGIEEGMTQQLVPYIWLNTGKKQHSSWETSLYGIIKMAKRQKKYSKKQQPMLYIPAFGS